MLSRIFLAIFVFVPALAFASFSDEAMNKELAGRYKLVVERGPSIQFLLRSSGAIELIGSQDFTASVTSNFSSTDFGLDGLPVVHVVIGEGSDEDWKDYHVILTAEQDGKLSKLVVLALFSTFNDGPNEISSANKGGLKLYKFDKSTDKFLELKN